MVIPYCVFIIRWLLYISYLYSRCILEHKEKWKCQELFCQSEQSSAVAMRNLHLLSLSFHILCFVVCFSAVGENKWLLDLFCYFVCYLKKSWGPSRLTFCKQNNCEKSIKEAAISFDFTKANNYWWLKRRASEHMEGGRCLSKIEKMTRGPEQKLEITGMVKKRVDAGALLSVTVWSVLLFSAPLSSSCSVVEENTSERDRPVVCVRQILQKAQIVPRWGHLVVSRRRWWYHLNGVEGGCVCVNCCIILIVL